MMRFFTTKPSLISSAVLFVLFISLAFAVKNGVFNQLDNGLMEAAQSLYTPTLTWVLITVSAFGDGFNMIIVFFAFALALLFAGFKKESYFSFVIWLAPLTSFVAKLAVGRERPEGFLAPGYSLPSDFSFPSGHVAFYACFFGLVVLYALTLPNLRKFGRILLITISGLLIALVGFSRVYLGVHYPTDAVGGYLLGFAILALVNLLYFRFIFRKDGGEKVPTLQLGQK